MMRAKATMVCLVLFFCQIQATMAAIEKVDTLPKGASIQLSESRLRIDFITDEIVRVRATKNAEWSDTPSLMCVEMSSEPGAVSVKESDKGVELKSSKITVRVDSTTGAVSYYDAQGRQLLSEASSPRMLEKTDVITSVPDPSTIRTVKTVDGEREVAGRYNFKKDREAWTGQVRFKLTDNEALYGLGFDETADMNLRGKTKRLYQHNMRIVESSLISTKGYGLLFDAFSAISFKDDNNGMSMGFDVIEELDYYFIAAADMDGVISGFRLLTGKATMLPKWAYGYVQSKERYVSQDDLIKTLQEFRDRKIPIDVIVQDWNYWKPNCWGSPVPEESRYPDMSEMSRQVHENNANLMISIWPNPSNRDVPGKDLTDSGYMLSGSNYVDFFNPDAADMYFRYVWHYLGQHGIDAWWCDSTEPEVKDWTGRRPENADEVNIEGLARIIDPELLNAYGFVASKQFYRNWRKQVPDKRLVNLTRSGYIGSQHTGSVVWTGDIAATWSTLRQQVPAILNFSAGGNPYVTCDVGAFFVRSGFQWFHSGDYNQGVRDLGYRELYTRWLQFGTFLPMFRSHGTDTPREPWRFGEPGTPFYDAILSSIQLRYRLLPYFYSLSGMIHQTDASFVRPVAFDYPNDTKTYDLKTQMLVGDAIMACPVLTPMYYEAESKPVENGPRTREVYLPAGKWIDFWSGKTITGSKTITAEAPISHIPLYVKAGSIIPIGPDVQYANEAPEAPIELRVYAGADGTYTYYEDAGEGWGYEKGEFSTIQMSWDNAKKTLTISDRQGSFPGMIAERDFHIVFVDENNGTGLSESKASATVHYSGKKKAVTKDSD